MPRGIFGMRLVLLVKVVCGILVYAALTHNNLFKSDSQRVAFLLCVAFSV